MDTGPGTPNSKVDLKKTKPLEEGKGEMRGREGRPPAAGGLKAEGRSGGTERGQASADTRNLSFEEIGILVVNPHLISACINLEWDGRIYQVWIQEKTRCWDPKFIKRSERSTFSSSATSSCSVEGGAPAKIMVDPVRRLYPGREPESRNLVSRQERSKDRRSVALDEERARMKVSKPQNFLWIAGDESNENKEAGMARPLDKDLGMVEEVCRRGQEPNEGGGGLDTSFPAIDLNASPIASDSTGGHPLSWHTVLVAQSLVPVSHHRNHDDDGDDDDDDHGHDGAKKEKFKWTDQSLLAMCDILNKYLKRYGRNSPFKWTALQLEFEKISHHKFNSIKSLKNKYAAMRKHYNLWKSLKNGENGLLDCPDDWWEKKIKENPEFKRIRKKQPSRELQEAWNQLFENVGVESAPSVDPNTSSQLHDVNIEYVDDDDSDSHNDDSDNDGDDDEHALRNMETEETASFSTFINEERQEEDVLAPNRGDECTQCQKIVKTSTKPTHVPMKRETTPTLKMASANCSNGNEVGNSSISTSISVINRMVDEGLMASCSEFWCFAVSLCEDDVKREIFLSLPDDVGRLAWLRYKQNLGS
ncbi:hypothetical protein L1987_09394 [Smallanthus sonchifolius]|uniref:Uncharacterized protein n=1 Tax=Smallanthus sonchifolius TaxID=185202 RepID=A0ACB9JPI1_9ASTR|nr:hypothetical protein L1987_09394 [Smallanthus sonchifolius]